MMSDMKEFLKKIKKPNKEYVTDLIKRVKLQNGKCIICDGNLIFNQGIKIGFMFTHDDKSGIMIPHIAHKGCCPSILCNEIPVLSKKKYSIMELLEELKG